MAVAPQHRRGAGAVRQAAHHVDAGQILVGIQEAFPRPVERPRIELQMRQHPRPRITGELRKAGLLHDHAAEPHHRGDRRRRGAEPAAPRTAAVAVPERLFDEAKAQRRQDQREQRHGRRQRRRLGMRKQPLAEHQQRPVREIERVGHSAGGGQRAQGQEPRHRRRGGAGPDHGRGGKTRQQRDDARKICGVIEQREAGGKSAGARCGGQAGPPRRRRRQAGRCEKAADHEFEGARFRAIVRGDRIARDPGLRHRQRDQQQHDQRRADRHVHGSAAASGRGRDHQQRKHDVELLLDAERPQVQQRDGVGRRREVAAGGLEVEIGAEQYRGDRRGGERHQLARREHEAGGGRTDHDGREQRRQNAPRPPRVKAHDRDPTSLRLGMELRGDQVAGNHEEYIDPCKAAGEAGAEMIQHHGQHGHGPQPVNVPAIRHVPIPRPSPKAVRR